MAAQSCPPAPDSRASCTRCGCAFDCGSMTRPFDCWCARLPALPRAGAQSGARGCLCPACYADELAAHGTTSGRSDAEPENSTQ
ncbi:hypothetical protein AB1286_10700 [Trinickia sp. NRRL B-1857]